jgi:UDP-galactose transporter B1
MFDGFTNGLQTKMGNSKPSSDEMMLFMNSFAALYTGAGLFITGDYIPAIAFCSRHPQIITDIALFALFMAVGQVFIFWCITSYGTLVCSMVTTTRKFFTILFSVFWFGHEMTSVQWFGVFIVFAVLIWDVGMSFVAEKNARKVE